jgi:hypothetical protein
MEFLKVSRSGGNQITYWKKVSPGNFRPTDEAPEEYMLCDVCETPIINGNCAHKDLGYSPKQWRERVESAQQSVRPTKSCWALFWDKLFAAFRG